MSKYKTNKNKILLSFLLATSTLSFTLTSQVSADDNYLSRLFDEEAQVVVHSHTVQALVKKNSTVTSTSQEEVQITGDETVSGTQPMQITGDDIAIETGVKPKLINRLPNDLDKLSVFRKALANNVEYDQLKKWIYDNDPSLFKRLVIAGYVENEGLFNLQRYQKIDFYFNTVVPTLMHLGVSFFVPEMTLAPKFIAEFSWRTMGKGLSSFLQWDSFLGRRIFRNKSWDEREINSEKKDRLQLLWEKSGNLTQLLRIMYMKSNDLYGIFEEHGYFEEDRERLRSSINPATTPPRSSHWLKRAVKNIYDATSSRVSRTLDWTGRLLVNASHLPVVEPLMHNRVTRGMATITESGLDYGVKPIGSFALNYVLKPVWDRLSPRYAWDMIDRYLIKRQSRKTLTQRIWWDYVFPPLRSATISEMVTKPLMTNYIKPWFSEKITNPIKQTLKTYTVDPIIDGYTWTTGKLNAGYTAVTQAVNNVAENVRSAFGVVANGFRIFRSGLSSLSSTFSWSTAVEANTDTVLGNISRPLITSISRDAVETIIDNQLDKVAPIVGETVFDRAPDDLKGVGRKLLALQAPNLTPDQITEGREQESFDDMLDMFGKMNVKETPSVVKAATLPTVVDENPNSQKPRTMMQSIKAFFHTTWNTMQGVSLSAVSLTIQTKVQSILWNRFKA
jgi:hypothetical protein